MAGIVTEALDAWRECRAEYDLCLWAQYDAAEEATRGALLNARGRQAGIDAVTLFMGPAARAHAYASEELLDHWLKHPRITYRDFEAQWRTENAA